MQIDRLLEIVLILLNKGTSTAKELSEKFNVSTRTIYRDIDTLSLAGIPVYANKGNRGGIGILKDYMLDKSILNETERKEIVFALQSLRATNVPNVDGVLNKVNAMFHNTGGAEKLTNWIEIDFSHWGSHRDEKIKFMVIKEGILTKRVITFKYINSHGEISDREVEPLRLFFKEKAWYLYGYCKAKENYRTFKISRIQNIDFGGNYFVRDMNDEATKAEIKIRQASEEYAEQYIKMKFRFSKKIGYRVYDDFNSEFITPIGNGDFIVEADLPLDEWITGYILSFGETIEVLEPKFLASIIKEKAKKIIETYK